MNAQNSIKKTVSELLPEAKKFLCNLIKIPSTSGREQKAMNAAFNAFSRICDRTEKIKLADKLKKDIDYSTPIPDLKYAGRFNIRSIFKGAEKGKNVVFNTHLDVVPPSEDMEKPWQPIIKGDYVFGRGACDAKGQAATLFLVMSVLRKMRIKLAGDVIAHLVVEEENGGNGTLAMVRRGEKADACIVLEPTDGKLFTSIRGAVWFKIIFKGTAGHSGAAGASKSALLMARDAIGILEKYHADLLAASKGIQLFDDYPNPMPITFGSLQAGNWPASTPSKAILMGVLGLLPNKTYKQVCDEMKGALKNGLGEIARDNFEIEFMYRHDSSVLDPLHPFPSAIVSAAKTMGHEIQISAMTASCDAWFYNNQLKIPTVVFGPGTLKVAHSKHEQISMQEIGSVAEILTEFLLNYCGVK